MSDEDAEGTITGRLKKPIDMIEFLDAPEIPKYMRDLMRTLEQDCINKIGLDFTFRPDRTSVMIIKHMPDGTMQTEFINPNDFGIQGQKADLIIFDDPLAQVDYSELEMRVLGDNVHHMLGEGLGHFIFQGPSRLGKTHQLLYIDEASMVVPKKEPKKQNGKPAAYLDLDPTKRHRRRRR